MSESQKDQKAGLTNPSEADLLGKSRQGNPSPRRWVILLVFSLLSFCNAAAWQTYSSVANYAEDYYGVGETAINWFEEIVLVAYIVGIPFTFLALNRSIHWTLFGCVIISTIGEWVRYVAFSNYIIALIGQFVLSLPNCCCLAMPPVLASAWFAPSEHFLCITLAETANFLGGGFGFLLSALVVTTGDDMPLSILIQSWMNTSVMLLYFVAGQKEPYEINVALNLREGMSQILKDTRLILILLSAGSGIGLSYTLLSLMQELLAVFDVDNVSVGIMGIIFVLCGFFSGLVWSFWMRKTNKLESPMRTVTITAVIGLLGVCLVLNLGIIYVFGIFLALTGIGIIGFMPLAIEAAIERLNHENLVTTVLFTLAQIWSLANTPFVQNSDDWFGFSGFWVLLVLTAISFIVLIFSIKKPETQSDEFQNYND